MFLSASVFLILNSFELYIIIVMFVTSPVLLVFEQPSTEDLEVNKLYLMKWNY